MFQKNGTGSSKTGKESSSDKFDKYVEKRFKNKIPHMKRMKDQFQNLGTNIPNFDKIKNKVGDLNNNIPEENKHTYTMMMTAGTISGMNRLPFKNVWNMPFGLPQLVIEIIFDGLNDYKMFEFLKEEGEGKGEQKREKERREGEQIIGRENAEEEEEEDGGFDLFDEE